MNVPRRGQSHAKISIKPNNIDAPADGAELDTAIATTAHNTA